jgi:hypothetical protein
MELHICGQARDPIRGWLLSAFDFIVSGMMRSGWHRQTLENGEHVCAWVRDCSLKPARFILDGFKHIEWLFETSFVKRVASVLA